MKKRKKLWTIIFSLVFILISLIIFEIVESFTGNPLAHSIAKHEITEYCKQVYDIEAVDSHGYNFKNGRYGFSPKDNNRDITWGVKNGKVFDSEINRFYLNKIENIQKDIKMNFKKAILEYIFSSVETELNGNYSSNFEAMQNIITLTIVIRTKDNIDSKEERADIVKSLVTIISDYYPISVYKLTLDSDSNKYYYEFKPIQITDISNIEVMLNDY